MMNRNGESLGAVLNEQIRCAEAMLDVLTRENQALVDGDAERLSATAGDKAKLVEALERLEKDRQTLAAAIGAAAADVAHAGRPSSPSAAWQTLLELVATCKDRNERNGALLKARSDQVRATLTVLRGTEPDCYAPSGMRASARSVRPLGSA